MNIIITEKCNKNCSFCFAKRKNKEAKEMSRENFNKLLEMAKKSKPLPMLKILGGEPTQHTYFTELIKDLSKQALPYTLITNGLFTDQDILSVLGKAIAEGTLVAILINASELQKPKDWQIFKANYLYFYELAKKYLNFNLTVSLTLDRHKTLQQELKYLKSLSNKIPITALRLSLDFQEKNFTDTFFIQNKEYGKKIIALMNFCLSKQIVLNGDCKFYPCMFADEFFVYKKLVPLVKKVCFTCSPGNMPFDIAPDLTYIHCYPAQIFRGSSILKFSTLQEAFREMSFRKHVINYFKKVPETCQSCNYFKKNACDSLCLGCYQLNSSLLEN